MTATVEKLEQTRTTRTPRRVVAGAIGVVLVLVSISLPLWRSHLIAPQYPDGLHLRAYGHGMDGDIAEVDALNHYIGMRVFNPDDVPEMALYPLGIAAALAAVVVATFVNRVWVRRLAIGYLWMLPVVILADIQFRLYQYGHDLDPGAAFRIPEFTPWVIGPTRVWNFTNVAYPGTGLLALATAAVVVTFGPRLIAGIPDLVRRVSPASLVVLVALAASAAPAGAADHDHHDHGDHPTPSITAPPTTMERTQPRSPDRPRASHAPGTGPLAERLAAARPGDTITVEPGTYRGNVVIDVPVHLVGEGRPTIEGTGSGSTIVVRAPGTTVSGFRVVGSGPGPVDSPAGIRVEADHVVIDDMVVLDAYIGIAVVGAARVHLVDNTVIGRGDGAIGDDAHAVADVDHSDHDMSVPATTSRRLRGDGISLWDVEGALLRGNTVSDTRDGVYSSFGTWILMDSNEIVGSRYGLHTMYTRDLTIAENRFEGNLSGVVLMYGGPALVLRNTITENRSPSTGFGVILKDVVGAEVVENVIARNRVGIHLEGPSFGEAEVRVHRNTIALNQIGSTLPPSARGTFSANSFVDNLIQIGAHGVGSGMHVEWSERGFGNFWSNYRGYEGGLPGRGSTPHVEGSRVDGIIERTPLLVGLASSPGMQLIRSVETQRFAADPVVVDHAPLIRPLSPPYEPDAVAGSMGITVAGIGLVVGAGLPVIWLLVPRRRARKDLP